MQMFSLGYIINSTIVWLLFLGIYLLFLRKTKFFGFIRVYLIVSVLTGAFLPLIELPALSNYTLNNPMEGWQIQTTTIVENATVAGIETTQKTNFNLDFKDILLFIYIAGVLFILFRTIKEWMGIRKIKQHAILQNDANLDIYLTNQKHQPFSFLGEIYITQNHEFSSAQLALVLEHEQSHIQLKHWMDNFLLIFIKSIFWFNPLVWLYHKFIRLNHEYQADDCVEASEVYDYGVLLLQPFIQNQSLQLANNFYFSPIKNRIDMLTKKQNGNKNMKWLALIPALLSVTFLMAQQTKKVNQNADKTTTFKGNTFEWSNGYSYKDSINLMVSFETKEVKRVEREFHTGSYVIKYNNEPVELVEAFATRNDKLSYIPEKEAFSIYLDKGFKKENVAFKSKISQVQVNNVVIDKKGKIKHYNLNIGDMGNKDTLTVAEQDVVRHIVDGLIENYRNIVLESKHKGKNLFFSNFGHFNVNDRVFQVRAVAAE